MLDLLLFPFKLILGLLEGIFGFIGGMIGMVFGLIGGFFGLVGGILGLVIKLSLIGLAIGVVVEFVRRHRAQKTEDEPQEEEFISYYDKDAVK
ncbi:MAG: hypothetical protein J6M20_02980 [Clostridia bacterium]|nr:hypothetical protein [Clostridia bacterium]